jgi:transcriptional regulator with XRE-family HTH domain
VAQFHQLYYIREAVGLTVAELAELSGISASAIYRIENNQTDYKINKATAAALAQALSMRIIDIFDPDIELSNRGRPPHTGVPVEPGEERRSGGPICPNCFVEVPRTGVCDTCGWVVPTDQS